MKLINLAGVSISCLLLLAACGKSTPDLPGKWVGHSGTFEFSKDNTGVVTVAQQRQGVVPKAEFKWSMEGKDKVRIYLDGMKRTVYGKLGKENELVIEDDTFVKQ